MATKAQFRKRLAELGCTFEQDENAITVDAPHRKKIAGVGVHYVTHWGTGDAAYPMSAVYDDCIDDLSMGLEDCTEEDCDVCHDN
jgi:hypothetical protein